MKVTKDIMESENFKVIFSRYSMDEFLSFLSYHNEKPWIYEEFKKISLRLLGSGKKRFGSGTIIGLIRFSGILNNDPRAEDQEEIGEKRFKISQRYASFYARLLCLEDTRFVNFFKIRGPRSEAEEFEDRREGYEEGNNILTY